MTKTQSRKLPDIAVPEALTALKTIDTGLADKLAVQINVATNALDQFVVQGKVHADAPFIDIATVTTDYTTPKHPMLRASGDLAAQAVGNGWFLLDCSGFVSVKLSAASGNVAGSVVDLYWSSRDL